jgi:anti-sigma B factor antagonist
MEIVIEKVNDVAVLVPRAEFLDASNYQEFKRDVDPVLAANRKVLLDISQLRFVDSSGLGAILWCLRKLAGSGGDLKLYCDKCKPVRMFFELVRMNRIIDIYNTREEAVAAFAGK